MTIILASASPRRKELLTRMGISTFQTISPDVDEGGFAGLPPAQLVETLSREKSAVVARAHPAAIVIAADTVVALGDAVLGKPEDADHAGRMLAALSGKRHQVYTGVTVRRGDTCVTEHEVADVAFRTLTQEEIARYVATGEPMDKAGAYGIQGYGSLLVEGIAGDYYNVMGLPVCRLGRILTRFGVDCLRLAAEG